MVVEMLLNSVSFKADVAFVNSMSVELSSFSFKSFGLGPLQ